MASPNQRLVQPAPKSELELSSGFDDSLFPAAVSTPLVSVFRGKFCDSAIGPSITNLGVTEGHIRSEEFAGHWLGDSMNRPRTRILVDGGDPQQTRQIRKVLGFVDGQTTNPSLIANNPEIRELLASGHKLSEDEEMAEYRKIVQEMAPLVGEAGVS
jgi:hypothetical protein